MTAAKDDGSAAYLENFFSSIANAVDKRTHVHALHPYPAKFIPHIPRVLIEQLSNEGDVVADPMCGSGTTMVEAAATGRRSMGSDINPIAVLASAAKTRAPVLAAESELENLLSLTDRFARGQFASGMSAPRKDFHNRHHWFDDDVAQDLDRLFLLIDELEHPQARLTAKCAASAIIVGVSRQESETRWAAKPKALDNGVVWHRFQRKLVDVRNRQWQFARSRSNYQEEPLVVQADARALPVGDESVDLIVTSPPYANSHDYYLYHKLRMFWLGHDVPSVQKAEIGSRNKHSDQKMEVDTYLESLRSVFAEFRRILRPGGSAAMVVADAVIRRQFHDMGVLLSSIAESQELRQEHHFEFSHKPFTSAFHRSFGTTAEKQTHVLLLRKD